MCRSIVRGICESTEQCPIDFSTDTESVWYGYTRLGTKESFLSVIRLIDLHRIITTSGRPLHTEFQVVGATKVVTFIQDPRNIQELSFFMLPNVQAIPANCGALICYAVQPFERWHLLGAINPAQPSGIFQTGWQIDPDVQNASVVQIGISIES